MIRLPAHSTASAPRVLAPFLAMACLFAAASCGGGDSPAGEGGGAAPPASGDLAERARAKIRESFADAFQTGVDDPEALGDADRWPSLSRLAAYLPGSVAGLQSFLELDVTDNPKSGSLRMDRTYGPVDRGVYVELTYRTRPSMGQEKLGWGIVPAVEGEVQGLEARIRGADPSDEDDPGGNEMRIRVAPGLLAQLEGRGVGPAKVREVAEGLDLDGLREAALDGSLFEPGELEKAKAALLGDDELAQLLPESIEGVDAGSRRGKQTGRSIELHGVATASYGQVARLELIDWGTAARARTQEPAGAGALDRFAENAEKMGQGVARGEVEVDGETVHFVFMHTKGKPDSGTWRASAGADRFRLRGTGMFVRPATERPLPDHLRKMGVGLFDSVENQVRAAYAAALPRLRGE